SAAFVLAAFGLTLSRYTGTWRMVIGMPVAGRHIPELARLVAVTVNLVPVLVEVDDDLSGPDFLRQVQESLGRSLDNAAIPFEEVVEAVGAATSIDRHPLVQAAFGMHDALIPEELDAKPLRVMVEEGHGGGAQFDLALYIQRSKPTFAGSLE